MFYIEVCLEFWHGPSLHYLYFGKIYQIVRPKYCRSNTILLVPSLLANIQFR